MYQLPEFTSVVEHGGRYESFELLVPEGTTSFVLTAIGEPDSHYVVVELVDPNGQKLIEDPTVAPIEGRRCPRTPFRDARWSTNGALLTQHRATLQVPNRPGVEVVPGPWKVRFAGVKGECRDQPATSELRIGVTINNRPAGKTGHVPIHLHFASSPPTDPTKPDWSAAGAVDNALLQTALAEMKQIFSNMAGNMSIAIEIDPTYHQRDPSFAVVERIFGEDNEADKLFATGQTEKPGINLFLVDKLLNPTDVDPFFRGLSPVIPGPGTLRGTQTLGVAVAHSSRDLGATMAREVAHFLGVRHSLIRNNLMHRNVTGDKLTQKQAWVMLRNPLVLPPAP